VKKLWWLIPVVAGILTLLSVLIGIREYIDGKDIEAANWVMAAGGLGLIVFASVQLRRETHREDQRQAAETRRELERLAAARAKLKPVAWLARRMCRQAVSDSNGPFMNQWVAKWYTPRALTEMGGAYAPDPISVLEDRMRETVTYAAEAGVEDVFAADYAFEAFIAAANIINDLAQFVRGAHDTSVVAAAIPKARKAVDYLAIASASLETLAPPGLEEPLIAVNPRFADELATPHA